MIPDSRLAARVAPSPNHGERKTADPPSVLILHYTGMGSGPEALAWLCDPASQVSSHYFVEESGEVVQLVPESQRAWHAGQSCWAGERDLNSHSLGVEIVNAGHPGGLPPFPPAQIAAVIGLCRDLCARYAIPPRQVLAHSDVAPGRKTDPGEVFPWDELFQAGIGHWVPPAAVADGASLGQGARGPAVAELQSMLARYGYDLAATGIYDRPTKAVVEAFQRHFRPARVDGRADSSTLATLRRLLDATEI